MLSGGEREEQDKKSAVRAQALFLHIFLLANGSVGKNKGGDTTTRTEIEVCASFPPTISLSLCLRPRTHGIGTPDDPYGRSRLRPCVFLSDKSADQDVLISCLHASVTLERSLASFSR